MNRNIVFDGGRAPGEHKALQARLRACLFPWQRQTEKSANAAGNSQQLSAKMQIMLSFARIVRQLLQK